jgi:geranylgeranyl reductase family protein
VRELGQLGVDIDHLGGQRTSGVRFRWAGRTVDVPWPDHPDLPEHGLVVRRDLLDQHLRDHATAAGAEVMMGAEATTPLAERGFIRGATTVADDGSSCDVRARYVVVADGANSRFGRGLGTTRERLWPYGVAARTYFRSDRSEEHWVESTLGLRYANGTPIAGYGWVSPMGDGTVNVGTGILSSSRHVKGVNTLKLLDSFIEGAAARWHFEPTDALKAPTRLRLPMGGSIKPTMGPTFLVVGDAAGLANPFNGDGIDAALMSGRLAADVLDDALGASGSPALQRYPRLVADEVGEFHQVGRLSARFVGRPLILSTLLRFGTRSDRALEAALRLATNALRPGSAGVAERAYALAVAASRLAPNW